VIRIMFKDHFHRPIWSIAIREGCNKDEPPSEVCRGRLTARMVRAPAPVPNATALDRSLGLARRLVQRGARTQAAIKAALPSLRPEWMEADLRSCPGISDRLARATSLVWLPRRLDLPDEDQRIWLDGGDLQVTFDYYPTVSTFSGVPLDGSPLAWGMDLAKALEPCWKPAGAPPPWRK
jgi:hypothetical protein